jgi:hypothetical protein
MTATTKVRTEWRVLRTDGSVLAIYRTEGKARKWTELFEDDHDYRPRVETRTVTEIATPWVAS